MGTNYYIGYFGGALVVIPLGALIANRLTDKVAGFKTRYKKALISTIVAYVTVNLLGVAAILFHIPVALTGVTPGGLQVLLGWLALTISHSYLLKSDTGERLTAGKSLFIAICQMLGAMLGLIAVLWIVHGVQLAFR